MKNVELELPGPEGRKKLLPEDPLGAETGPDGTGVLAEIRPQLQASPAVPVGENRVFVLPVKRGQMPQEAAQVDLRAAHPSRDKIQRIDADSHDSILRRYSFSASSLAESRNRLNQRENSRAHPPED